MSVSEYKEYTYDKNFAVNHYCVALLQGDAGRKIDDKSWPLSYLIQIGEFWVVATNSEMLIWAYLYNLAVTLSSQNLVTL